MKWLMEGSEGVVASFGVEDLRKSPDGGFTLIPLTESDVDEFRRGNLFEDIDVNGKVETLPKASSFLSEDRGSDGFLYINGPMFCCDKKNGNGRIYERGIWEGIKGNKDVIESISHGGSKGHLEHPKDGKTDLNLVSHVMVPYNKNGVFAIDENGIGHGRARILNTAPGKQLQELYRGGVRVGFSSRGKGSTFKRGNADWVAKDYMFETFDAVASPSVSEATPGLDEKFSSKSRYSLASDRHESIKLTTEATSMSNAKDTLRQLEDNLRGISGSLDESNDAIALASLREGLLDQQMAIRSAIEADPSLRDAAEDLATSAKDLRTQVTAKMESLKDHTVDEVINRVSTSQGDETELQEALKLTKDRLDYYRAACEELAEADDMVTRKEYEAAIALSEGLLKKCKEFQADNSELVETLESQEGQVLEEGADLSEHPGYKLLEERYEKALLIIEELTSRIRNAQVSDRVEEVIKLEPRFAKIRDDLLECTTVNEVNSRVERLARLLDDVNVETSKEGLTEEEALAILSESFRGQTPEEQTEERHVEAQPPVQLTESQAHRLGLINSICGTSNFRK